MSLSTLNIDNLLEQTTDKFINHSDYATLRKSCILLSPVSEVTAEVKQELNRLLETDKQNSSAQLTLDACQNQIKQDLKEKEHDHLESQQDLKLTEQLQNELLSVQNENRLLHIELNEIELRILRHQSLIQEVTRQITLQSHIHSHPENTHNTTHTHPDTPTQHTHSHPEQTTPHTHAHPESTKQPTHSHPEQLTQNTHAHLSIPEHSPNTTHTHSDSTHHHETESLELQKRTLSQELVQLEEISRSKQIISQKQKTRTEEITDILNRELPAKEKKRNERTIARKAREQARLYEDTTEKQLSSINYRFLQQAITTAHQRLQNEQQRFMQLTEKVSYKTFLARLGLLLPSINLSHQEKEALNQIFRNMSDYLLITAEEQRQHSIRLSAASELKNLTKDLQQKENRVAQLKKANPKLHDQNKTLEAENQLLEHTIEEQGTYRDYILKIGLFGLLGTGIAVGGGFLGMYLIPTAIISLCFAPAAVVSLITVGVFIATLAYTLKNNSDNNQLEHNKTIIQQNITDISKQSGEIISLENVVLPSIKENIRESETDLNLLDQKILSIQQKAEGLLNRAKQIVVPNAMNQSFFSNEIHLHPTQSERIQTTPRVDEVQNTFSL